MGTKLHKNIGEASTVPAAAKTTQSANARRSHGAVSASVRSSTPTKPCISSRLRVVGEMAAIVHLLMMCAAVQSMDRAPFIGVRQRPRSRKIGRSQLDDVETA